MSSRAFITLYYERLERAQQVARLLQWVPYIRLVGLNGSMATGTMKPDSDIDFFIATAPNRLYLTRFLVVLFVHLTGWRRYGQKIRGRICLNRFATTNALVITPFNDYHARVFSVLAPLYAQHETYRDFYHANAWMDLRGFKRRVYQTERINPNLAQFTRRITELLLTGRFGDYLERKLSKWQQRRIQRDPRTEEAKGRVRTNHDEICLHPIKH